MGAVHMSRQKFTQDSIEASLLINVPVSNASASPSYISISLASVFQHECDGEEDGSNVVTAAAHNSIIKSSKKKRESKGRKEKEGRSKEGVDQVVKKKCWPGGFHRGSGGWGKKLKKGPIRV